MCVLRQLITDLVEELGTLTGLVENELVTGIFTETVERVVTVVAVFHGTCGPDRIIRE